jgi:hypothetical protein
MSERDELAKEIELALSETALPLSIFAITVRISSRVAFMCFWI